MRKERSTYPYLLGLIFVAIIALASGPTASGAPVPADGWLGVMPPSPELRERVERGEAKLPQVMTDADFRRSLGVNQPAEMSNSCGDPGHTYTNAGKYTVRLTITDLDGASDTARKVEYIFAGAPVTADFSGGPASGLAPLMVKLTDLSSGDYDACLWNFGDGGFSNSCGNPSHAYASRGIYSVSLMVSGAGGSATEAKSGYIAVFDPVTANFSGTPTEGSAPLTVNFSNTSSGDAGTCLWQFGDGSTSNSCGDPGHTYTNAGKYTVSLTVSGLGGDSKTETKVEYILASEPVTTVFSGSPTEGPAPLTVNFSNESTGEYDTCLWEFGDGNNSSDCNNPGHTYVAQGVYTVNLTVSGVGGSDRKNRVNYVAVMQHRLNLPLILR